MRKRRRFEPRSEDAVDRIGELETYFRFAGIPDFPIPSDRLTEYLDAIEKLLGSDLDANFQVLMFYGTRWLHWGTVMSKDGIDSWYGYQVPAELKRGEDLTALFAELRRLIRRRGGGREMDVYSAMFGFGWAVIAAFCQQNRNVGRELYTALQKVYGTPTTGSQG